MTDTTSIKHPAALTDRDFTTAEEPFALFAEWFAEAMKSEPSDPNAMALATVDVDGLPDLRMVLMKGYDSEGFVFYSSPQIQKPPCCFTGSRCAGRFAFAATCRR